MAKIDVGIIAIIQRFLTKLDDYRSISILLKGLSRLIKEGKTIMIAMPERG